jgi:hypothetical protein
MKRKILYSSVFFILLTVLLFRLGFFYVSISAHNSHHLNKTEKSLIDNAISQFRERVENGKFEEIAKDLSKGRQDSYWENIILKDIQNDRAEYGKPLSWEFFRSAQPQLDKEKGETVYHLDYLTKYETEEVFESFIWSVKENNEINLINTDIHLPQATEWRIEERDKQKLIVEKYSNEIIIPYADRYIEFRY